ncbi:capsule assembly Wzi family protein [Emcibacter sp.]|uniref:capsule assembly Wzi family protein n=1 Tax=Emcibacter sp. TaxID=1979954 RepID=UPI002AA8F6F9|nr:capsule assembly Wzi family protein [Emcibacter sp.]
MQLRNDVEVLAGYGLISGPVMTWPLTWRQITSQLHRADDLELPAYVRMALRRVRAKQPREFNASLTMRGTNSPALLRGFGDSARSDVDATVTMELHGDTISAKGAIGYRYSDSGDVTDKVPLDGSYFAKEFGTFQFYVGTIDRWWSTGRESALMLSNNARPMPSIGLMRSEPKAFESKWLSWLGPWDLRVFLARMEEDRYIAHPLVLGIRVKISPIENMELGAMRALQVCGEGRPCGFNTWTDALFGGPADNTGTLNEPGNQLGGFDFSYSFAVAKDIHLNSYFEFTGEDEGQYLPVKFATLWGASLYGGLGEDGLQWRLTGEYSDTSAKFKIITGKRDFNVFYNHSIYRNGFRYEGRSLGHSLDNDVRLFSLRSEIYGGEGWDASLAWHNAHLNRDDAGYNPVSLSAKKLDIFELSGRLPTAIGQLAVETRYMTDQPDTPDLKKDRFDIELGWRVAF